MVGTSIKDKKKDDALKRNGISTQLAQAAADKQLIIPIVRRFPFAEFREAHRAAKRGADGKIVLVR